MTSRRTRGATALVALLATLAMRVPSARGDAHESSVSAQAMLGLGRFSDPKADRPSRVAFGGGALRFSWATKDWLAYEAAAYGGTTDSDDHRAVPVNGSSRDFSRGAALAGIEAGVALRLGVRFIPTAGLAIGPQFIRLSRATLLQPGSNTAVGTAPPKTSLDISVRGFAGFDVRFSRRFIAGVRGSIHQAAGLSDIGWRSTQITVHASYYWYPRWWRL